MPVIDIHAHYVSPNLMDEAARNGAQYGVRRLEDDAAGEQRLVIANTSPLRPVFAELSDLRVRLPMMEAHGASTGRSFRLGPIWRATSSRERKPRVGPGCKTRLWRTQRALCPTGSKPWARCRCSTPISPSRR